MASIRAIIPLPAIRSPYYDWTEGSPALVCPQAPLGAGLSFRRRLRSHIRMDPDLERVIRQALGDALAVGRDHTGQTELAIEAVQRARPDMTASDALAAVNLVRRE